MTDLESRLRAFARDGSTGLAPDAAPPRLPEPDVAYALHDTVVGVLVLAVDRAGTVLSCSYDDEQTVTARLSAHVSPRVLRTPVRLDPLRRALDDYLAGRRRDLDLPVSLALATPFARRVLTGLRDVRYGARTDYGRLAGAVGAPRAARAVGGALGGNPVCLLLPCHRVVRSDGSPGGYAGGPAAKQLLLALEAGRAVPPGA